MNLLSKSRRSNFLIDEIESINPQCPYASKCGGCDMQHIKYEDQLKWKQYKVEEVLGKFGHIEEIVGMENPNNYRNKVHATFQVRKRKVVSGMYEENTHKVVDINNCMIQNEKANEIIETITRLLNNSRIEIYNEDTGEGLFRHVLIRTGHKSGQVMVVLVVASNYFPSRNKFVKALIKKHPEISTVVQNINNRKTSFVLGYEERNLRGSGFIVDTLCKKKFRISSRSFYQINSIQTEKLYNKVIEYANLRGDEVLLDAYCGIGTIGIIASDFVSNVIGVELNGDAVKDAIANSRLNKTDNVRIYKADASEFMRALSIEEQKIDVLVLDPPREGSTKEFLESTKMLAPSKIIYVSCNPETQARDIELLKDEYEVVKIQPVDMFPFTSHVETVVLLTKK